MLEVGQEWVLHTSPFRLKETTTPTNAQVPVGIVAFYAKDSGGVSTLCYKNDAGTEICLPTVGSIVSGSGTANHLAMWSSASVLTDFSPTAGSVLFGGVGGIIQQANANFFWDDTNKFLGLNQSIPLVPLHVKGNTAGPIAVATFDVVGTGGQLNINYAQAGTTRWVQYLSGEAGGTTKFRIFNSTLGGGSEVAQFGNLGGFHVGNTPVDPGSGVINAQVGFRQANAAASGNVLRGNGTNFVSAVLTATDIGSGAALTKVDDTNVTLTLGGTPTTALLRAASLTLGWTGTLAIARGGTGSGTALGAFNALSPLTTRGDLLTRDASNNVRLAKGSAGAFLRGDGTDTMWSTLILPNAATANRIAYASATNTYGESANLAYDGTDFLLGSGTRARMSAQNRFRFLNSMCVTFRSTNQTISNGTVTSISFDAEQFDTDGLHEAVINPTRLTAALTGKYVFFGYVQWADNSTGIRYFQVLKNGSAALLKDRRAAANETEGSGVGVVSLTAADYIEFQVFQTSGGNLDVAANNVQFGMAYVGE